KHRKPLTLPVQADPAKGGFVIDTSKVDPAALNPDATGTIVGMWGFDHFRGPQFQLKSSRPQSWRVLSSDATALVVGRDDKLQVSGQDVTCVSGVAARDASGKLAKLNWKSAKPGEMEIEVPLSDAKPGRMAI